MVTALALKPGEGESSQAATANVFEKRALAFVIINNDYDNVLLTAITSIDVHVTQICKASYQK